MHVYLSYGMEYMRVWKSKKQRWSNNTISGDFFKYKIFNIIVFWKWLLMNHEQNKN